MGSLFAVVIKNYIYKIDGISAPIFNRSVFVNVVNVGTGEPFAFLYFGTKYNDDMKARYYYKCGTRKRGGKTACSLKPVRKEPLEQFVMQTALENVLNERVIDCFVNSIYLFDDRIVVNFNYQEGGRPVSLEEVLSSFLDGNGAPKASPHGVSRHGGLFLVCTLGGLEQGDGAAAPEPTVRWTVG